MFSGIVNEIARDRAIFARDVELIRENAKDADVQEMVLICETCNNGNKLVTEGNIIPRAEEIQINEAINKISDKEDPAEIDRILASEKPNIGIDEIMGISGPDEPTETEFVYNTMMSKNESVDCESCKDESVDCENCREDD